jgi:hypothetical protein
MKNTTFPLRLSAVILVITSLFMVSSCTKEERDGPCLAIFAPDLLQFNIVDKNTGADLLFSGTPTYTVDQIYFTINGNINKQKPRVETSATLSKYLTLPAGAGPTGTIKLYLADELKFTIDYTLKKNENSNCSPDLFDKLTINGTQMEQNVHGRIVQLKL